MYDMIYRLVLRWYTTYWQTPSMIHHIGGQSWISPSLSSWSLLFICLTFCVLPNQHLGYECPLSPSPWSHHCITEVPQRPRGAQPPISLVQLENILKDAKLQHQEAERPARFHRNFVAKSDSWISVYYFYQKYSSSSNPLLYSWHLQTFTASEARLLCRSTSFITQHTISNAELSNKLFSSQ